MTTRIKKKPHPEQPLTGAVGGHPPGCGRRIIGSLAAGGTAGLATDDGGGGGSVSRAQRTA